MIRFVTVLEGFPVRFLRTLLAFPHLDRYRSVDSEEEDSDFEGWSLDSEEEDSNFEGQSLDSEEERLDFEEGSTD